MSLLRTEHILDDAIEASIPDWVYEQRKCVCGSVWPKDDLDENGLCPDCHDWVEEMTK